MSDIKVKIGRARKIGHAALFTCGCVRELSNTDFRGKHKIKAIRDLTKRKFKMAPRRQNLRWPPHGENQDDYHKLIKQSSAIKRNAINLYSLVLISNIARPC